MKCSRKGSLQTSTKFGNHSNHGADGTHHSSSTEINNANNPSSKGLFVCGCGKVFETLRGRNFHQTRYICPVIHKQISQIDLSQPIKTEDENSLEDNENRGAGWQNEDDTHADWQSYNNSNEDWLSRYYCVCGQLFSTQKAKLEHQAINKCIEKYTVTSNVVPATPSNVELLPFQCVCGKRFLTQRGKSIHFGKNKCAKHKQKELSEKSFANSALLQGQMKVNKLKPKKRNVCPCGKRFATPRGLNIHRGKWKCPQKKMTLIDSTVKDIFSENRASLNKHLYWHNNLFYKFNSQLTDS